MRQIIHDHLNPDQKPSNIFKILALVVALYGVAKTRQMKGLISENGLLSSIPAIQGVPIPNSAKPGETAVYRYFKVPLSGALPNGDHFISLYHTFQQSVKSHPAARCLGERKLLVPAGEGGNPPAQYSDYQWMSYAEVSQRAASFGSGLKKLTGIARQGFVGLYAQNCPLWVVAEQGAFAYSLVTVALYDTLGADSAQFIIKQTEMSTVVCSYLTFGRVLEVAQACPSLKFVVVLDEDHKSITPQMREDASRLGFKLYTLSEVEAHGAKPHNRLPLDPPTPDDLANLMYTSGTTGDPKGAMLTHGNFLACLTGLEIFLDRAKMTHEDVHLSYLPLAHVFERLVQSTIFAHAASVGFFRGNVLWLLDDLAVLKPTIFPSVPRLLNRVYDKITAAVQALSPLKRKLFELGYAAKRANLYSEGSSIHPFWDRLLFSKFAAALGGRVRWILTGAAPISPEVLEFLRIVFCCRVMEGYGQTEGTGVGTATVFGDIACGHVGPPNPVAELKLVDIPDMDYLASDKPNPRGEICIRSASVIRGYYLLPDKTAETIDEEGWLHSGDVGELLPSGCVKIIDRKKNLFKLAQGEYVAPEKIENVITRSPYIAQCFVYGDSLQPHLVAVVVPDEEVVAIWSRSNNLAHESFHDLCKSPELREMLFSDVVYRCKEASLGGFEIPKAIHVSSQLFTVENDILTPTFKLKRNIAFKVYADVIKQLYAEIPKVSAAL